MVVTMSSNSSARSRDRVRAMRVTIGTLSPSMNISSSSTSRRLPIKLVKFPMAPETRAVIWAGLKILSQSMPAM